MFLPFALDCTYLSKYICIIHKEGEKSSSFYNIIHILISLVDDVLASLSIFLSFEREKQVELRLENYLY